LASGRGGRDGREIGIDERRGVGDTVGRSGDLDRIWRGGDDTQRLRGLSIGLDLAGGIGVDAGEVLVVTIASLEGTVLGVVGGIVSTSNTVEDVFAVAGSVGACGIASLETESVTTHKVVPLDDLLKIALAGGPGVGEQETAEGVTTEVGAMGVELPSIVIGRDVNEGLVDETDDLDVVWGLHELNTLEGTSGDFTSAVTGLGAPGNFPMFRLTDGLGTIGRCPETEVLNRVNDGSLAEGFLVLGRRVASVVTSLIATNTNIRVSLVWKVTVVEMLGSQGNEGCGGR
jgi:hypothetical protein